MVFTAFVLGILLHSPLAHAREVSPRKPADFVEITSLVPSIRVEMMYFSTDNFLGRVVAGYKANLCYVAGPAAVGLQNAQGRLEAIGKKQNRRLTLLMKDCYRPHKGVQDFVRWTKDKNDTVNKEKFYPTLAKNQLIPLEYISSFSGHSRGSTVDLTLAEIENGGELRPLEMGTIVDFFGDESHTQNPHLSKEARENRQLLIKVMSPEFKNYAKEWWHFSLTKEPYPETAFDFDVE